MSHVLDRETGGTTPFAAAPLLCLPRHTALRAIAATVLKEATDLWQAASLLDEMHTVDWAFGQFRRCLGLGLADEPHEVQATFLLFLADAWQAGDLP